MQQLKRRTSGIIRPIDALGRIVIPKEIRKTLGLKNGISLELFWSENGEGIYLEKYMPEKDLMYKVDDINNTVDELCNEIGREKANSIKAKLQELEQVINSD